MFLHLRAQEFGASNTPTAVTLSTPVPPAHTAPVPQTQGCVLLQTPTPVTLQAMEVGPQSKF